jgi:hypothetical protein
MYDNDLDHKRAALGRGRECDHFDDNNKKLLHASEKLVEKESNRK